MSKDISSSELASPAGEPPPVRVQKPAAKRPRYNNKGATRAKGNSNAEPLVSKSMVSCLTHFRIYTSSNGLVRLADKVYEVIKSRAQHQFAINMPSALLRYVTALAFYCRLIKVNEAYGFSLSESTQELKTAVQDIKLPGVLCRYVEALGLVQLASGAQVIPYVDNYRQLIPMASEWYYDPLEALEELEVPDPDTPWSLDHAALHKYVSASSQFFRCGIELRTVASDTTGHLECIVGYITEETSLVAPRAPERLMSDIAELGAAYMFRDCSRREEWPFGDNYIIPDAFLTERVSPEITIAKVAIAQMH